MARLSKTESRNQTEIFTSKSYRPPVEKRVAPLVHPKPQKSALHFEVTTCFKILPSYSVQYARVWYPFGYESNARPDQNFARGALSEKAEKRIRSALQWLMFFSERKFVYSRKKKRGYWFKINFITLTLSSEQVHKDKYIVEHLLQPFLRWLQRHHGVINYVWKAETQDNGNIHFHVTINKFVHYAVLRKKWNDLQRQHGYISSRPGDESPAEPNSTDVHSVVNNRKFVGYMTKYLTKSREARKDITTRPLIKFALSRERFEITMMGYCDVGQSILKREVDCKLWGCNYTLSRINLTASEGDTDFWNEKNHFIGTYCSVLSSEKYFTVYANRLPDDAQVMPMLHSKFRAAYNDFMTGDDRVLKYVTE